MEDLSQFFIRLIEENDFSQVAETYITPAPRG
jgi:hypothetical protein